MQIQTRLQNTLQCHSEIGQWVVALRESWSSEAGKVWKMACSVRRILHRFCTNHLSASCQLPHLWAESSCIHVAEVPWYNLESRTEPDFPVVSKNPQNAHAKAADITSQLRLITWLRVLPCCFGSSGLSLSLSLSLFFMSKSQWNQLFLFTQV